MTAQKILLADDSVTIRKVVELTFADEGIEVVSVSDGDAAMEKFAESRPDMVIADVNMPGMNGYQICESIKSQDATRHIPVILLVGSFEPFDPGEASRVGANYYFTKPFHSIRELVDKVSEYLALGADSQPNEPETADIENLYHQSFQDTLEMPETIDEEHPDQTTAETLGAEGNYPFDTAEPSEPVVTVEALEGDLAALSRTDDPYTREELHAASEPFESFRGNAFVVPETSHSIDEIVSEPVDRHHESAVSTSVELGDAGMDDDIIETTHPGIPENPVFAEGVVNPFDERVEPVRSEFVAEADAAMANFDWKSSETASDEEPKEAIQDTTSLKFVLDDEEPGSGSSPGDLHVAPREDSAAPSMSEANISPELIETIVQAVIERMSDRTVREVAQEAVPRIAEKLIREALDEDNRK